MFGSRNGKKGLLPRSKPNKHRLHAGTPPLEYPEAVKEANLTSSARKALKSRLIQAYQGDLYENFVKQQLAGRRDRRAEAATGRTAGGD